MVSAKYSDDPAVIRLIREALDRAAERVYSVDIRQPLSGWEWEWAGSFHDYQAAAVFFRDIRDTTELDVRIVKGTSPDGVVASVESRR